MRRIAKSVAALLCLVLAQPAPAAAQALPDAPIPYETLQPQPRRAASARPAPRPPARPSAAAPAAAAAGAASEAPASSLLEPPPALRAPNGARLAPGEAMSPAELEAFVDGVVRTAMARDNIAGVTVSVVQNGQIALKKGYGFADLNPRRPVDPDRTLFRIGSISKTFTWILLMNEVEAGRMRIDAPVNLYLPERLKVPDQGYGDQPIRMIHLMDHSPGFEDRTLGQLFERRFERVRPMDEYLRQERPRRVRAPGQFPTYSNYGVGLAGAALVYATDQPFERLVETRITGPLGMNRTTFREPHPAREGIPAPMPPALAADLSEGYRWAPGGFEPRPLEYIGQIAPAGAASSTAADMARYMQMLLNGGQLDGRTIYGPRAARAFATPLREAPAGLNGWRHGFIEYHLPGGYVGFGHAGGTLSFMSNMVVAPQLGLGVFISTNTETGGRLAMSLTDRIVDHFYLPPTPFPPAGSPKLVEMADVYNGYYLGTRRPYRGLESFVFRLLSGRTVQVTDDGRLTTTGLDGARTWAPLGDPAQGLFIDMERAERLAFDLEDGRARALRTGFNDARFERGGLWDQPGVLGLLALLAAACALATLAGLFLRNARELRQTMIQSRASLIQTLQAVLWLAAFALLGVFVAKASDIATVMYGWPGLEVILASACALVAAVLTAFTVGLLPAIWRGGRRLDSWTLQRKIAFTVTVVIYAAFSAVLGVWGALTPWQT